MVKKRFNFTVLKTYQVEEIYEIDEEKIEGFKCSLESIINRLKRSQPDIPPIEPDECFWHYIRDFGYFISKNQGNLCKYEFTSFSEVKKEEKMNKEITVTQQKCKEWWEKKEVWHQTALVENLIKSQMKGFETEDIQKLCNPPDELHDDTCVEVFEWWLITPFFAQRLLKKGEVIIDNDYGSWWGRQGTGQAVYMDTVMEDLCQEDHDFHEELNKKYP